MITNSLEWNARANTLKYSAITHIKNVKNYSQVVRMINNIEHNVTDLSKAEVLVRAGCKHSADDILNKINKDIEMIEEYIVMGTLIG